MTRPLPEAKYLRVKAQLDKGKSIKWIIWVENVSDRKIREVKDTANYEEYLATLNQ